ncbi:serine/threonine-protein kinase [Roseimaritima ulvae]|uniref:serine/threonine-protein kinase n=1 Tax=Roseimaritima ulvae TaxID=980254 RepID=UPI00082D9AAE|nr:serine/threonine-protein kinase [Roseimaritima ulvae]
MSPQPDQDRNLLYGIIAHQMDFVSADALMKGMNEWILRKATPLGEILRQQGVMDADTCELIEALVAKHVARHQGDAQASIAALKGSGSIKQRLSSIDDEQIHRSLRADVREDPQHTLRTLPPPKDGEKKRFRVLRSHARGGIGEVYVAEDSQLAREVALKELQQDEAYNEVSRARFMLEAEITGSLEHPGIVPVYGMGCYDDGRPYYAMRFIRGESLKQAIDAFHQTADFSDEGSKRLALHKLLRRFIDVCNAIEYAHSRGVLHRDIKPANVMLGRFGETLVVDWGLGKPGTRTNRDRELVEATLKPRSGSGSLQTRHGSVFGTPAYMPPEQAAGQLDRLGPTSDVYSLGATLYDLLTGQPPVNGREIADVLVQIKRGNFPAPSEIAAWVPRPLDAICRKALATNPSNRYLSPRALAEDIEHWLADEPVDAYRESSLERAARWMRNHRTLVSGLGAGALASIVFLSTGLVLLNNAWRGEVAARVAASNNYQLAEERFQLARDAVDKFYVQVSEEVLLDEPGLQPVRRELLSQALEYYSDFVEQRGDDPALRHELGLAWFRIGAITEQLQSPRDAIEAYQSARRIQTELLEANATLPRRAALADTLNAIGRVFLRQQRLETAADAFREALRLREENARLQPGDTTYQRKLASSTMNVGIVARQMGSKERGYELINEAQRQRREALAKHNDLLVLRDLGMGHYNLAVCYLQDEKRQASERNLASAIEAFEEVLLQTPRDATVERRLAQAYSLLADGQLAAEDAESAIENYYASVDLFQSLSIRNPDISEFTARLASLHMNLASAEQALGNSAAAHENLDVAVSVLSDLSARIPDVPVYRRDLAVSLRKLASLDAGQDSAAAKRNAAESKRLLEGLMEQFPGVADYIEQFGETEKLIDALENPGKTT